MIERYGKGLWFVRYEFWDLRLGKINMIWENWTRQNVIDEVFMLYQSIYEF
jgi:hypothetical protein